MSSQLWRVAIPLGLYSITSAMFFPVSQSFIFYKICLESEDLSGVLPEDCANRTISSSNQYLQTQANRIFLIGSVAMTITGIFSTTFLGKFGDEKSRKLAMIVPLIGLLLADGVLMLLAWIPETSPYLYVLSETIFGLCGGYVTILSSSFAFGSHLAKTEGFHRSKAMAVLEGSIGVGSVIGFFCTSFIKKADYLNAYFAMTAIHALCIGFVLTLRDIRPSKETLEEKKAAFLSRLITKLTSWTHLFKAKERRKKLIILMFSFGLSFFSFIGTIHILFYYLKQRFHWDLNQYAYLKAPDQMLSTLAILFIFPFLKSKDISDPVLALLGLSSRCLGRLWLAISWNTPSVYFLIVLDSLSRFSPTAIRSMFSKSVAENEQGQIFSLISVVELTCTLLASISFHTLFPYSISFFPQLSFVLMGCFLIPPIIMIGVHRHALVPGQYSSDTTDPTEVPLQPLPRDSSNVNN